MKDAVKASLKKPQNIISLAAAVIFVAAFVISYIRWGAKMLDFVSDPPVFKAWLDSFGIWGRLVFIGIRALQTVVKIIPAEPLEIGSGFAYGTFGGCLMCLAGTFIGSLVIIALTKLFGKRVINLFISDDKIKDFAFLNDEKRISGLLWCVYLLPGTPKDFITYLEHMLPIKTAKFLAITMLARIPSIISSTWCGSELGERNYKVSALIFGATLALSLIGIPIYRKLISLRRRTEDVERTQKQK